jgi:hypothetical protein
MTTTPLKHTANALGADSWGIASQIPIPKPHNNHVVARWLRDENSKLYCQWTKQN